jgi:CheY-like chemotaxis protein
MTPAQTSVPAKVILVVDDDRDAADTIALLLESTGFPAVCAYSARDGLDRLDERGDFDLVISDIRMPGLDGFDFLRVVRHRYPQMPVVLTTGMPVDDDDVIPRGARILQKPFAVADLQRAVDELLADSAARARS